MILTKLVGQLYLQYIPELSWKANMKNNVRIYMRANAEEKKTLQAAAIAAGFRNLTNFVMSIAMREAKQILANNFISSSALNSVPVENGFHPHSQLERSSIELNNDTNA